MFWKNNILDTRELIKNHENLGIDGYKFTYYNQSPS